MNSTLKPRIIKGSQAEYIPAEWNGTNESARTPVGKNVLIKMDTCAPKTSGGIELPANIVDNMNMAAESGVVVCVGSNAFRRHDDGTVWDGVKVAPGDRVDVNKYSGSRITGADGCEYRSMGYENIVAVLDREAVVTGDVTKLEQF